MDMYQENILDHYKHPRNKGKIEGADFQHREPNPLCGDVVEIYVKMADGKVVDLKWEGSGCAISQASASILYENLLGKTEDELNVLNVEKVLELLQTEVNPARMKCATLGLVALQKALQGQK
ncbi:MAG: SUF system NifU family Fe-S cluster assembly protein [Candidatus Kerfeldbacteria bacterium RIFCSPLOWO2_01_FULL_48_11]|uniref:SUF system NifU family Fe-S cluster assembly protein n=1 Tax=Candidatus Kerfeldbacteria bacterium RIFCSPLOWO2_01_FULL_48_11 TaxID=1798543 RepID=A0A1G2B1E0_9BACT|nr:MAG: SUF system FeS assembly protein, NifU family [Parcubacteria group bacterium GW2011_GWA2_48_9]KKW16034.1 MAG: SUF system FeS assembly protein, NifU family [Parcubacteria group bacterium GW2011_GWC2_49_9]OGY83013.1 MAG: SUF system NifU family Fe-S cluster assembly protein [Candidatus Kerfeldbacteria bacterium RIFCSPLOWO2_01_FULL_48_11]HCM68414.1 SUF system NifU family Fe-S cluster assembly protein [Candidatus Kerfeldbacteria bacterium]